MTNADQTVRALRTGLNHAITYLSVTHRLHGLHDGRTPCEGCEVLGDLEQLVTIVRSHEAVEANQWLVWSHEHRAWWGPHKRGYTSDITQAGRYTHAQALDCASSRSWESPTHPPEVVIPAPTGDTLAAAKQLETYVAEQIKTATAAAVEARRARIAEATR